MKHIEVVAAIIMYNGKILCMQRGNSNLEYLSKKFEFPGGKIESFETQEEALVRELREELEVVVDVNKEDFLMTVEHAYPDFRITMHAYVVPIANDEFIMNDHIAFKWLNKHELLQLDWAAADIPIVKKLMEVFGE